MTSPKGRATAGRSPQVHKGRWLKKLVRVVHLVTLIVGVYGFCFGAEETLKGFFVDKEGRTYTVREFLHPKASGKVCFRYEGERIEIPLNNIKSLTDTGSGSILVNKRSGKSFEVQISAPICFLHYQAGLKSYSYHLEYILYDKVKKTYSHGVADTKFVKEIVFVDNK